MLVRGVDSYGHFEPERPPSADFAPDAIAYHAAVQERLNAITNPTPDGYGRPKK